jgi:NTP pyrophosphatase (non-canonical NTP hydrolase)
MDLVDAQANVRELDRGRGRDQFHPLKVFADIREEMAEIWQYLAWVPDSAKLERAWIHRDDIELDIGNLLFHVIKLANQFGVDAESGLRRVLQIHATLSVSRSPATASTSQLDRAPPDA